MCRGKDEGPGCEKQKKANIKRCFVLGYSIKQNIGTLWEKKKKLEVV